MTSTTVTSAHLTLDDVARVLDGDLDESMRAHLRSCSECTALLEREAKLDEDVSALKDAVALCPGCDRAHERSVSAHNERCSYCGVAFAPGGFVVDKVLAESDHGRLYLAKNPGDGELVALKEIVFARVPDVESLDRFEREARLLKQLRHARIPRYLASFAEGDGVHLRLYLAQRYVDGPALVDEMETRRFNELDAREIAREVLVILADLQALSPPVIHRDVKPANLVRDRDGKLALVDFGSARDVAKTMGGTLVGTYGYMPVEQLSGVVDESTDVYALGATLLHLLTRRPPWESQSTNGIFTMSNISLSPGFKRFLASCLAPRERRFQNARVALDALADVDKRRMPPPFAIALSSVFAVALGGGLISAGVHFVASHDDTHALVAPLTPPVPPEPPMPPGVTLQAKVSEDPSVSNPFAREGEPKGLLDVSCPAACEIAIDANFRVQGPIAGVYITPGVHVLSVGAEGKFEHGTINIDVEKRTSVRFDPNAHEHLVVSEPDRVLHGYDNDVADKTGELHGALDVTCSQECNVSVDGKDNVVAPIHAMPLRVGNHDVHVYANKTKHMEHSIVRIEPGKTVSLRFDVDQATPQTVVTAEDVKKHYSGKKITIDLKDADLENVVRLIGDVAQKNIVLDVGNQKLKVSMRFINTPWDKALDEVAKAYALVIDESGDTITVRPGWRTETPRAAP